MFLGEEFIERVEPVRRRLSTVESYILAGGTATGSMESFEEIVEESSPGPPGVVLRTLLHLRHDRSSEADTYYSWQHGSHRDGREPRSLYNS